MNKELIRLNYSDKGSMMLDIALPLMSGCMVLRIIIERHGVNQDMDDVAIKRKKRR